MTQNTEIDRRLQSEKCPFDENFITEVKCQCEKQYRFLSSGDEESDCDKPITLECECGHKIRILFPVN